MGNQTIIFPKVFVLRDKHIKHVVSTLQQVYKADGDKVYFDFSLVEETRRGDYMVLAAQIEKVKQARNITFYRKGKKSNAIEKVSGGNVLRLKTITSESVPDVEKFRTLDPQIAANVKKDLKKIGINPNNPLDLAFCERIEALLTEITGNAIEHGIRNKMINCWLTTEVDNKTKKVLFTFVDMGRGIAKSHRKTKLPLPYRLSHDGRIVRHSISGKLQSSTKIPHRGKGLPEIKQIVEGGLVSNFELITNKIALVYGNNGFQYIKIPNFAGTYYSWSVTKENRGNFEKWKNM